MGREITERSVFPIAIAAACSESAPSTLAIAGEDEGLDTAVEIKIAAARP